MLEIRDCRKEYTIHVKSVDLRQVFIVACLNEQQDGISQASCMLYLAIVNLLNTYSIQIIHERIFADLSHYEAIAKSRNIVYFEHLHNGNIPFTYIDGKPCVKDNSFSVNLHGVILDAPTSYNEVYHGDSVCGYHWQDSQFSYILLHDIHGDKNQTIYDQTTKMFDDANNILRKHGYQFSDVVRTWIYFHDIFLDYDEFNCGRRDRFSAYGLLPTDMKDTAFESVFLPASTGIECKNTYGISMLTDVLAVQALGEGGQSIRAQNGVKQKSAYRYGSAFSRSMVVEDNEVKYIYLSGTASIDEHGETVFLGDIDKQIQTSVDCIRELIGCENMDLGDICEATVFLQKPEYLAHFRRYCAVHGLENLPWVITKANVCRDNLLFEIDAIFSKLK